jgi:ABC-type Na+ efflux pump permease subunit
MRFLPVAMREAIVVSRSAATYHWRWIVGGIGLVSILLVLFGSTSSNMGRSVFEVISAEAFVFCAMAGTLLSADSLASEKRQDTLGLLLLTPLRPFDVLTGKLVTAAGKSFFGALAFLPLIALPILAGGVEPMEYALVASNLLLTLFFSLSVGILISAIFKNAIVTTTLAYIAPPVFVFWPILVGPFFFDSPGAAPPEWFWGSPFFVHAATLQWYGFDGNLRDMLCAMALIHLLAWTNLFLAGVFLRRTCGQKVPTARAEKTIRLWRNMRFGSNRARAKLRTLLLDQSPLSWLANREQVSSSGLMILLLATLFGGIGLHLPRGEEIITAIMEDWWAILLTMHAALIFRMATAACAQLAEDRRSGALELLLCTNLTVGEILRGRSQALTRQFFGPMAIVLFCHLCALILLTIQISVGSDPWETDHRFELFFWTGLAAIFALAWRAIGTVGAWQGLRRRNAATAVFATLRSIAGLPILGAIFLGFLVFMIGLPYGKERPFMETIYVIEGIFTGGYLFTLRHWARNELEANFRKAAVM